MSSIKLSEDGIKISEKNKTSTKISVMKFNDLIEYLSDNNGVLLNSDIVIMSNNSLSNNDFLQIKKNVVYNETPISETVSVKATDINGFFARLKDLGISFSKEDVQCWRQVDLISQEVMNVQGNKKNVPFKHK